MSSRSTDEQAVSPSLSARPARVVSPPPPQEQARREAWGREWGAVGREAGKRARDEA